MTNNQEPLKPMKGCPLLKTPVPVWASHVGINNNNKMVKAVATQPIICNMSSSTTMMKSVKERLDEILSADTSNIVAENKTKHLVGFYTHLIPDDRTLFLRTLATEYGTDSMNVLQFANNLSAAQGRGPGILLRSQERLRHALIPRYQILFTYISRLEGGVKFLVDLRSDIIPILSTHGADQDSPFLHALNSCLRDLLSLWFSVGFLQLERITWESPCDMLQKISEYEAVHPIRNWTDLKRRVGSYRRCFVFTHGSMPREPVVVLHTALTSQISRRIQDVVWSSSKSVGESSVGTSSPPPDEAMSPTEKNEDESQITTAIFYSITSTQKGLQGVELGNYLIKSAVKDLLVEFPRMHQFASLSPIPGFREWVISELNKCIHAEKIGEQVDQLLLSSEEMAALQDAYGVRQNTLHETLKKSLLSNSWAQTAHLLPALEKPLMRLCARYLYLEKRRGFALNPVANFHLRNGAVMWRINWLGDMTPRGLTAACGLMVNYRYYLEQTEENSLQYMESQTIASSEQVQKLVSLTSEIQAHTSEAASR